MRWRSAGSGPRRHRLRRRTTATVRIWDEQASPSVPPAGHLGGLRAVAVGRLGGRDVIVSAGGYGTVRIWDQQASPSVNPSSATGIVSRGGGRSARRGDVIVSAGGGGTVRIWDEQASPSVNPSPGTGRGVARWRSAARRPGRHRLRRPRPNGADSRCRRRQHYLAPDTQQHPSIGNRTRQHGLRCSVFSYSVGIALSHGLPL